MAPARPMMSSVRRFWDFASRRARAVDACDDDFIRFNPASHGPLALDSSLSGRYSRHVPLEDIARIGLNHPQVFAFRRAKMLNDRPLGEKTRVPW